ncbi:hypothetical protein [Kytococcus sedentarius]|uniref:hypothetical protein n=1 Tax=Kytococcus sedentarius TaxID=1276 RepID=UPI001364D153|nr:hypothetical protein [Kytococcus sedentarius]
MKFTKTIKTDEGREVDLVRETDAAADIVALRAQGWVEEKTERPTLPAPPTFDK